MINWSKIVGNMSSDLNLFVNRRMSAQNLYKSAVANGVGPELRPLVRSGAEKGRKVAREALRRRGLLL